MFLLWLISLKIKSNGSFFKNPHNISPYHILIAKNIIYLSHPCFLNNNSNFAIVALQYKQK